MIHFCTNWMIRAALGIQSPPMFHARVMGSVKRFDTAPRCLPCASLISHICTCSDGLCFISRAGQLYAAGRCWQPLPNEHLYGMFTCKLHACTIWPYYR